MARRGRALEAEWPVGKGGVQQQFTVFSKLFLLLEPTQYLLPWVLFVFQYAGIQD